jgi:hypothetical protein
LGLTDIDFGNLAGQKQIVGEWWFTSSLLGHFSSFQVGVEHLDSRGNPDLSLVDSAEIHELTRSITAYGNLDDGVSDFLVNDIPDANDYPDAIYFSNATKTKVGVADTATVDHDVTETNLTVNLSVKSSRTGWNFARINDPGNGRFKLQSVTRVEDGQVIPLTNVWQTAVTLPEGGKPIYENKLHFVDTFSAAGLVNYTLVFAKANPNPLKVDSITNVPAGVTNQPLDKVEVHFNKPVYEPTFDWTNMTLQVQGVNVMDSTVTTTKVNDSTFYVNFDQKTQATGLYVFTVNTAEIYDKNNLPGELGEQVTWIQDIITPLTLLSFTAEKSPNGGSVILDWKVENQVNTDHFEVERSTDGVQWDMIGSVKAAGNYSGTMDYNFTDKAPLNGSNLYRLKQLDINGKYEYSPVRTVSFKKDSKIIVYPNPAKSNITIDGLQGGETIGIYDAIGSKQTEMKAAGKTVNILLSKLSNGVYYIRITGADGNISVFKIVKGS